MALAEAARFDSRIAAEVARLNLSAGGIESILFDAEMNSFGWGPMLPVRLMVEEDDVDDARRLLAGDLSR